MRKILNVVLVLISIFFLVSCSNDSNYLRITQGNYYNDIIYEMIDNKLVKKIELSVTMIEKSEYEKLDKNKFTNEVYIDNEKEIRYFSIKLSIYDEEFNVSSHDLFFKNKSNNVTFKFISDSELFDSLELIFTYQGVYGDDELIGKYSDGANIRIFSNNNELSCELGLKQNIDKLYENYINHLYNQKYNLTINKFIAKIDYVYICLANVLDDNYIEKDNILSLNFLYDKNTKIYIFKDNEFFYLVDAYEQGIITSDTIIKIHETLYGGKVDYPLDITLDMIYPWINKLDNILSITKINDLDNSDLFLNNSHIIDSRNIDKFINWLCTNKLVISNSNIIDNTSGLKYVFNTNTGKRIIEIYDNKVIYNNHTYMFEDDYFSQLPYLEYNSNSYSFNFNVVSGEVYKNGTRVGFHDFSFEYIYFDIDNSFNNYEDEYTFITQYGEIKIYDSLHFEYNNQKFVIEGKNNLEDLINKANMERYYIATPYYLQDYDSGLSINQEVLLNDSMIIELMQLNNNTNKTLSELFNCNLSDEYLINNYNLLVFKRIETSHLKTDVTFSDLFIEGGNIYITKNYKIKSVESNDENEIEFIEMILIPKSYISQIKNKFTINYNYTYTDGYKYNLLSYEYLDYIKVAEKEKGTYHSVYQNIKESFGQYGEATAVMFNYGGALSVITYDYIEDIVIKYPDSNVIKIYFDGHMYNVSEAYGLEIISYNDVLEIVKLYNK